MKLIRNLVTGGAGFLGSHLIDRLMDQGEEVICLDNFYSGSKANIEKWFDNHNFELVRHDITIPINFEVDKIWHLACPASPYFYQLNPIKTSKISFLGTYNILGLAKRVGAKLLFTSTSEIYGDPLEHPQKESYRGNVNTTGIRSCYDEGKRIAETLCYDYARMHNLDIRVMRIFNTYGPRMRADDGRVVSNFIVQALRNEPLTIYGDGSQTRSFCYVNDLIDGMIKLMESQYKMPINIGNPDEYTILEVAKLIKDNVNPKIDFCFKPLPPDDPVRRLPDINLAKKELQWEPKIPFIQGIESTANWFKDKVT